ncbi:hypothetical protein PInf_001290 [Phytophthora infestans]|nr:hypothetical protein PInf_001290 [Phytophthora infestans]
MRLARSLLLSTMLYFYELFGFVEQFGERDRLLLDIIAQTDDWNENLEATNKIKEAKQVGIESSGELMRRLAVNESVAGDDDDENDDGEKDSDAASKVGRKRSAQLGSA